MTAITVETLALAKALDPAWLREMGVDDLPGGGVSIAYLDEDGRELYRRKRDVPGDPRRFVTPAGVQSVAYGRWRLPEADVHDVMHVCEGESDAWALWAAGFSAVGLAGSNLARRLTLADLGGAGVAYVCVQRTEGDPSADRRFSEGVAARLAEVGYQGEAYAVLPPPGVKDVSDMRAADPATFRTRWERQQGQARRLDLPGRKGAAEADAAPPPEDRPILTRLADVTPERITWLWQAWLPDGCLCVLDGDPGLGKSSLTLEIAARLSRGDAFPPLSGRDLGRAPCSTLLLGAEDSLKHTVRPRLDAMGADCSLIHALEGFTTRDGGERLVVLPRDLDRVADFIRDNGVRLVVVDPLMAYLSSDTDAHKDQDVRRCLRPLARLADRLGIVVLLVRHLNKLSGGPALYRGGSSIGITGAARASLIVGRDPIEDRFILAMNKINVGPKPPALAYRLEGAGMACRVAWDGECELRPDQILGHGTGGIGTGSGRQPRGRPATALEEAKHFLVLLLSGGPVETAEMKRLAKESMIADATLERARADLSVEPFREGKTYFVRLPPCHKHFDGAAPETTLPWDTTDDNDEPSGEEPIPD